MEHVSAKILLVEDNTTYAAKIAKILKNVGYQVDVVNDPLDGIAFFAKNSYDMVISDLKMETMSGVKLLSAIKKIDDKIKTIILTANPTPDSELEALNIYVDRYLVKEVRTDVLLKYIEQILRVENNFEKTKIFISKNENISISMKSREVYKNNEKIVLTKKEFELLCYFLDNKGSAISREEFIKNLWKVPITSIDERVVDVHIKTLRKKLKCHSIISLRGFGYMWDE
jgi:Response regulators consisting of a CheY-like receiver domain and a winged-helix DNA-binding domain